MSSADLVRVGFSMRTREELEQQIAYLLAMAELQGPLWLCEVLTEVHLLPNASGTGAELRVVLTVSSTKELGRVLSVDDRRVRLQSPELDAKAMERFDMPKWVVAESKNGITRTNLSCAKHLAELLFLLLDKMKLVAHNDHRTLEFCFWKNMHNTRYENPVPPPITDSQCRGLMVRADACRDHILATWRIPSAPQKRTTPPLSFYKKIFDRDELSTPHLLDPKEFPKLGALPSARASTKHDPTKINQDDVHKLWKVAWFGLIPGDHEYVSKPPEQIISESAINLEAQDL